MQISALKENFNNENRVALTPDTIKLFQRLGLEVLIEDGAGNNSGYPNDLYEANGAKIVSRDQCLSGTRNKSPRMVKGHSSAIHDPSLGLGTRTPRRIRRRLCRDQLLESTERSPTGGGLTREGEDPLVARTDTESHQHIRIDLGAGDVVDPLDDAPLPL